MELEPVADEPLEASAAVLPLVEASAPLPAEEALLVELPELPEPEFELELVEESVVFEAEEESVPCESGPMAGVEPELEVLVAGSLVALTAVVPGEEELAVGSLTVLVTTLVPLELLDEAPLEPEESAPEEWESPELVLELSTDLVAAVEPELLDVPPLEDEALSVVVLVELDVELEDEPEEEPLEFDPELDELEAAAWAITTAAAPSSTIRSSRRINLKAMAHLHTDRCQGS